MTWNDIQKIRAEAPLVHNITNFVVMNTTANALLALGASPVMAHASEEVEEMVGIARALVLNIGTLSSVWIEAMLKAGRAARARAIPVVLDPVGAGATTLRTKTCKLLLEQVRPTIVRGNASEIRALTSIERGTKGVDSTHGSEDALGAAMLLSKQWGCVVVVTGAVDLVVQGDQLLRVANGHPMMTRVTGLGCTATALVGAFAAVNPDPLRAAAHAMVTIGIAGELAAERSAGPGSLQLQLLDVLYGLGEKDVADRARLSEG
jgi:hydroxyethylthiazole kinase